MNLSQEAGTLKKIVSDAKITYNLDYHNFPNIYGENKGFRPLNHIYRCPGIKEYGRRF